MTMPVPPVEPAAPAVPAAGTPAVPAAPAAPAVPAAQVAPVVPAAGTAPQWEGEFDPARAARLVENLRTESNAHKAALTAAQAKVAEFEQAQMSEQDKVAQRAQAAETRLAETYRKLAMVSHKLPENAAEFLTATSPEDIEAQAKRLAATFPTQSAGTPPEPLPPTLPIPGNGSDPAATSQLSREDFDRLSPPEQMAAYRAGRTRSIGGK